MCIVWFLGSHVEQMVGGKWNVKDLIGGTEEQTTIRSVASTWLRKRCYGESLLSFYRPHGEEKL
jgi:hypothetical protein